MMKKEHGSEHKMKDGKKDGHKHGMHKMPMPSSPGKAGKMKDCK